jgi:3-hydroxybutyryl-CoA dehydratase
MLVEDPLHMFTPGQTATFARVVTDADVALFALVTDDQHPAHLDQDFIEQAGIPNRLVPVALVFGLVEAAHAATLPGGAGIVTHIRLDFANPAYVEDELTVSLTLDQIDATTHTLTFAATVRRPDGAAVASGATTAHLTFPTRAA